MLWNAVKMSYLFENLTIPLPLYDDIEKRLLARKDSVIRSADDQIARIAAQMQQPLQKKTNAQNEYYQRRDLLTRKVSQQKTP